MKRSEVLPGMLAPVILGSLNHLLRDAEWARRRLRPHAGQVAEFQMPLGTVRFQIGDEGLLVPSASGGSVDLTLVFSIGAALAAFAGSEAAMKDVRIAGNVEFGESLGFVLRHLEWDREADLASVVGDAAAPRLHRGLRDLLTWQRQAFEGASANLRDYLVVERRVLVGPSDLEDLSLEIGRLRDDLARLEQRIAKGERIAGGRRTD